MFPERRLLIAFVICLTLYSMGHLWSFFFAIGYIAITVTFIGLVYNVFRLYLYKGTLTATRKVDINMSNGMDNLVEISLANSFPYSVNIVVLDEAPDILQLRDNALTAMLEPGAQKTLSYNIHPVKRGLYTFHNTNVFVNVWPFFVSRRIVSSNEQHVRVYPAFKFLHNMEMLSFRNREMTLGAHTQSRIGQSKEFENIREYVLGDDYRMINWKASARRHLLMVNQYAQEKRQDIYAFVDKGRGMQHTFENLSLLDYSINSTLQLSFVCIQQQDNVGLLTFERNINTFFQAVGGMSQIHKFREALYAESTEFAQSDYSALFSFCQRNIKKRSLLIIYTQFDSVNSLNRQMPYIKELAKLHLVLIVFFIDSDIQQLCYQSPSEMSTVDKPMTGTEVYATQMVAQRMSFEQHQIVRELKKHGIFSLLTSPESLTVNVINQYLALKERI